MTTLPTWAYWITALGSPVVGAIAVIYGHRLTRRGLLDADKRWQREETMRTMRWACEMTGRSSEGMREVGFAVLTALAVSELLQEEDKRFIDAVALAAVEAPADEYGDGTDIDGVEVVDDVEEGRGGEDSAR